MPWTEQVAEKRAVTAENNSSQGSNLLHEAHNTGLVDMDQTKPDVTKSVVRTGQDFQQRLKENPMAHLNSTPGEFAKTCRQLYTEDENAQPNRRFSVLLLVADPLHFDARRSLRVGSSEKQAQQYFGKARAIRKNLGGNQYIYTLEIQVVGARVSDLLKDNLQGLSLAASVSARDIIQTATTAGLGGACAGVIIKGISDVSHLSTVLTAADELSSGQDRGILQLVTRATGQQPISVAELAHSHGLKKPQAGLLGEQLIKRSTALNPLTESQTAEDTFIVHPQLTQEFVIIPFWDELSPSENKSTPAVDLTDATLASIALGSLATFGVAGMNQITTQVIKPSNKGNHVSVSAMKQLKR